MHNVIAEVLKSIAWRNRDPYTLAAALRLAERWADRQWEDSLRRARDHDPKPNVEPGGPILFEHYFEHLHGCADLAQVKSEVTAAIRVFHGWFCDSDIRDRLRVARHVWIEPKRPPAFPVGEVEFVTKVGLAVRLDNQFLIYDWKTGRAPEGDFRYRAERRQVCAYAMWPHLTLQVPVEQVVVSVVFLGEAGWAKAIQVGLQQDDVPELLWDLQLCVDAGADILRRTEEYRLEDFDYASSVRVCTWCPFQELCQRLLDASRGAAL